jgi:hypothetical protein
MCPLQKTETRCERAAAAAKMVEVVNGVPLVIVADIHFDQVLLTGSDDARKKAKSIIQALVQVQSSRSSSSFSV